MQQSCCPFLPTHKKKLTMSRLTLPSLPPSWSSAILHRFSRPQTGSCCLFPMNVHYKPTSHYQKQWQCHKALAIFIIVMILWQGRLPCPEYRACTQRLAASRPPVPELVIGWLAVRRMLHCLVNGWPKRRECSPQGRHVPIKGSFPAQRLIVIAAHIDPLHTNSLCPPPSVFASAINQ